MEPTTETNIETLIVSLGDLRLKHCGQLIKQDLDQMEPQLRSTVLSCLSKWTETEKAERRASLIASLENKSGILLVNTVPHQTNQTGIL